MSSPRIAARLLLGVVGIVGELDPARLAAPAGQHLRLDGHLPAELLGGAARLLRRRRDRPSETGMPKRRKSSLPWYSYRSTGVRL